MTSTIDATRSASENGSGARRRRRAVIVCAQPVKPDSRSYFSRPCTSLHLTARQCTSLFHASAFCEKPGVICVIRNARQKHDSRRMRNAGNPCPSVFIRGFMPCGCGSAALPACMVSFTAALLVATNVRRLNRAKGRNSTLREPFGNRTSTVTTFAQLRPCAPMNAYEREEAVFSCSLVIPPSSPCFPAAHALRLLDCLIAKFAPNGNATRRFRGAAAL